MTVQVTLQYFAGCPSWRDTKADLELLAAEMPFEMETELIDTHEKAEEKRFRGSPTVLIDGVDPFADPDAPVGLACRVYRADGGFRGTPTVDQLREALVASSG